MFPVKFDSVEEKLSFLMNTKQNEKSTFLYCLGELFVYLWCSLVFKGISTVISSTSHVLVIILQICDTCILCILIYVLLCITVVLFRKI